MPHVRLSGKEHMGKTTSPFLSAFSSILDTLKISQQQASGSDRCRPNSNPDLDKTVAAGFCCFDLWLGDNQIVPPRTCFSSILVNFLFTVTRFPTSSNPGGKVDFDSQSKRIQSAMGSQETKGTSHIMPTIRRQIKDRKCGQAAKLKACLQ